MKNLPSLSARKVIKTFKKLGFVEDRQKGSHLILINLERKKRIVVPIHQGKTIKKPLLQAMVEKDAGLTLEEFLTAL